MTFDNATDTWFDELVDWASVRQHAVNKAALLKVVKMVPNRKNLIRLMSEINGYRFDEDKNAIRVPLPNLYKHC